jgi:hypothetical protein
MMSVTAVRTFSTSILRDHRLFVGLAKVLTEPSGSGLMAEDIQILLPTSSGEE